MPRRSRSLGAGSQNPIRSIPSLLKNLDPAQMDRIQSSFAEAEDLLSFHSQGVPERQQRRRISGLVKQLQITVQSSVLGGFVSWQRLDDPRIAFYELQLGDDSAFSTAETFKLLDTFFSIEGATTRKFIRVRGVRLDGETAIWSATKSIDPSLIGAPKAHSIEFYPKYVDGADPSTLHTITYGGDLNPNRKQTFYTILAHTFYVDRIDGGISIWGYASNRLREAKSAGSTYWDRVRFTVNGIHRMDGYFPLWTNAYTVGNTNFTDFKTPFYPTAGQYTTGVARGGYTAAFGPYAVEIPNTLAGVGPNDPGRVTSQEAPDGSFYWDFPMNATKSARFDEAQLESVNVATMAHEAAAFNIGGQQKRTHYLVFQNFNFDLPSDAQIVGIQADLKRRQPNVTNDDIATNFGLRRPDKLEGHDLVIEYRATVGVNTSNVSSANILEDVNFGRYLDLTAGRTLPIGSASDSGRLEGDNTGIGNDGSIPAGLLGLTRIFDQGGNNLTVAAWIIVPANFPTLVPGGSTIFDIVQLSRGSAGSGGGFLRLDIVAQPATGLITTYQALFTSGTGQTVNLLFSATGNTRLPGVFHHVAATWTRSNRTFRLYVDGVEVDNGVGSAVGFTTSSFNDDKLSLGLGKFTGTIGNSVNGQAQCGFWNTALSAAEIKSLYEAKGTVDYRFNFDKYVSANSLNHYFLVFPVQADIQDLSVYLMDESGVRRDLPNRAATDESWPQLSSFFYTDLRQCTLPLAESDGIPHDNHIAIGYQNYGGPLDLWGRSAWSVNEINSFYFGFAIQAQNASDDFFRNSAFVDHGKMTIFTTPRADREVDVSVSVASANQFYAERFTFGSIINAIEIGSLVGDLSA